MPRSSGRRPAVSRPAPRASSKSSTRSASTTAYPTHVSSQASSASQTRQPGLFANMASTAAGVAVGSTIGHTLGAGITSMFGGSSAPAEQAAQSEPVKSCEADARAFTRCLDENNGNMQICDWYLQQLKSCQAAASQY